MAKTTYLFGAGASIGAVPIQTGIPLSMEKIAIKLNEQIPSFLDQEKFPGHKVTKNQLKKRLADDLMWLVSEHAIHGSIDQYARNLSFAGGDQAVITKAEKIKNVYTAYFTLAQSLTPPDIRYRAFFNKILNPELEIKNDVKILSWNYDHQMEKVLLGYPTMSGVGDLDAAQSQLRIHNDVDGLDSHSCKIFKLNGTAFYNMDGQRNSYDIKINGTEFPKLLDSVLYFYGSGFKNSLRFAWEIEPTVKDFAYDHFSDTEELIIIGYSLPDFNLTTDLNLILSMTNLTKVRIQDKQPSKLVDRLKERLGSDFSEKVDFIPDEDVETFYIPFDILDSEN